MEPVVAEARPERRAPISNEIVVALINAVAVIVAALLPILAAHFFG